MWNLDIRNIAGIKNATTTIEPGTNAVQASNWQGKSSLIAAVKTVMGTGRPLTEGESAGKVELETDDGNTHRVELRRENGRISREGEPFITDEQDLACADLFAFLDESNEVREAVRTGGDLKPLLTRPLDLEDIDRQIRDRQQERDRLDRELEEAKRQANEQDTLQQTVTQLEAELAEHREELAALDTDSNDSQEDLRDELSTKRTESQRAKRKIGQTEEQIERLETKLVDKQEELRELEIPDTDDICADLSTAEEHHDRVQSEIDLLETIYNTNQETLETDSLDVVTDVERQISGDSVVCWVCGQDAERETIEERLAVYEEKISERRSEVAELQQQISELKTQQSEREQAERRETQLQESIADLEQRLTEKRADLESAEERADELEDEVATLEDEIEETDEQADEIQEEITRLEVRLEDAEADLEAAEEAAEKVERLEDQREEIAAEIRRLRDRKESVIETLVESFEDSISTVIGQFEPSFEAARLVTKDDAFELVIARDGREVGVDALSEGEVELLGFIVALAGYQSYEVADRVPILLLDGVGGLAGEHLERLVEYLEKTSPMVVTTSYPEQGMFGDALISPEGWSVVSD
jgi:DNA repair exonuclease SbcCD ATPase subunit